MEQRSEARFEANRSVKLTWLAEPPVELEAQVINVSGRGIRLLLDRELPLSAALRIDLPDTMLLGEVCYRERIGDRFAVGLKLEHSLARLAEVQEMVLRVLGARAELKSGGAG